MIKNYLKTAFRNIRRQMWIQDELNLDSFQKNTDTIYPVEQDKPTSPGIFHVRVAPFPIWLALKEELCEIKNLDRYGSRETILLNH